jgi:parallel beta-helix repeat protein
MKVLVVLLAVSMHAFAATYYVSNTGDDHAAGTTADAAWKTVAHVNAQTFMPGDSILFKRGDIWREVLRAPSSGSPEAAIKFGAYGTGEIPVFDAALLTADWTAGADGERGDKFNRDFPALWTTRVEKSPNQVFFNNQVGTRKSGVESLTAPTDWYWAAGHLYVYSSSDPALAFRAPGIEASWRDSAIDSNRQSYLTFENLKGEYANSRGGGGIVIGSGSANITIEHCEFAWNFGNGVWIYETAGGNLEITSNDIHDNASGIYEAQYSGGTATSPVEITFNWVHDNLGGDGIAIYGNYFTVDHNVVDDNGRGGNIDSIGIHVYTGDSEAGARFGRHNVISWNIVHGQKSNGHDGSGIEVDHYTTDNMIHNNIVYENYGPGIDVYDCEHVEVDHNTSYGNSIRSVAPKAEFSFSTGGRNLVKFVTVANNIGYATCSGCFTVNIDGGTAKNSGIVFGGNLWYGKSENWYGGGTVGNNLDDWNELTHVAHNDMFGDPLFTDVAHSDFSLSEGSPARNAGVRIDSQGSSYEAPDLGALPYPLKAYKLALFLGENPDHCNGSNLQEGNCQR